MSVPRTTEVLPVRAAAAALGPRGRTSRIPDAVRAEVLAYGQRERAAERVGAASLLQHLLDEAGVRQVAAKGFDLGWSKVERQSHLAQKGDWMQGDPAENGHVEIGELPHSPGACPSSPLRLKGGLVPWAGVSPRNASSNRTATAG